MHFWIKDFILKKSLFKKRIIEFKYFNCYKWKKLKIFLPLSNSSDISFYTSSMINAITEDLRKKLNGLEEYQKTLFFVEQLNKQFIINATKIGR